MLYSHTIYTPLMYINTYRTGYFAKETYNFKEPTKQRHLALHTSYTPLMYIYMYVYIHNYVASRPIMRTHKKLSAHCNTKYTWISKYTWIYTKCTWPHFTLSFLSLLCFSPSPSLPLPLSDSGVNIELALSRSLSLSLLPRPTIGKKCHDRWWEITLFEWEYIYSWVKIKITISPLSLYLSLPGLRSAKSVMIDDEQTQAQTPKKFDPSARGNVRPGTGFVDLITNYAWGQQVCVYCCSLCISVWRVQVFVCCCSLYLVGRRLPLPPFLPLSHHPVAVVCAGLVHLSLSLSLFLLFSLFPSIYEWVMSLDPWMGHVATPKTKHRCPTWHCHIL